MSKEDPRLIPIQKALVHNTEKNANTDFLTSSISPSKSPSIFRIMVSIDTAARFEADITYSSAEITTYFNQGSDLTANCLYTFDLILSSGDSVNFQVDDNVTILVFRVLEIPSSI